NCFGLCCVALYFAASEGFPTDKAPGQPCQNLQGDFRCGVHTSLREMGLKGCTGYDCFGAGQKVAQVTFGGSHWRQKPENAQHMFEAFLVMRQLHEMLWYLTEALRREITSPLHGPLGSVLAETEGLTCLSPEALVKLDLPSHREKVNDLLLQTSELVRSQAQMQARSQAGTQDQSQARTQTRNQARTGQKAKTGRQKKLGRGADLIGADLRSTDLRGANLRGAFLIAADLRGADLTGTDLIGADLRDADLRGADLSRSLFLTQAQLNVAKGNAYTILSDVLDRPAHWSR
ncbi:MAG TPA: pentapeptide repeat-containing protein, partial [Bacillota bacterium]|nr:pentapeptide repeat-containing protein [Bacillota bacterium]